MRGEDHMIKYSSSASPGSPPHARGRRQRWIQLEHVRRITPACAGKTFAFQVEGTHGGDHPRMRGEDRLVEGEKRAGDGSPPHARGRLCEVARVWFSGRITPACAGKTLRSVISDWILPDHPRMRGEDGRITCRATSVSGSPPHARGRLFPRHTWEPDREDHPRMRGEDATTPTAKHSPSGSPPHARGRRRLARRPAEDHRITPACAGKTSADEALADEDPDHPRMRGEDRLHSLM